MRGLQVEMRPGRTQARQNDFRCTFKREGMTNWKAREETKVRKNRITASGENDEPSLANNKQNVLLNERTV